MTNLASCSATSHHGDAVSGNECNIISSLIWWDLMRLIEKIIYED